MRRLSSIMAVMALVAGACSGSSGGTTTTSTDPPATTTSSASGSPTTTSSVTPGATTTSAGAIASTTTTAPPDLLPPQLAVTYPAQGARITESPVQFRGTIEPGCTLVAAGRYPVTVTANGVWTIVLFLDPGSNVAVFDAFDAAGNQTTVNRQVFYSPPTAQPDYLRWSETGLYRVEGTSEVRLMPGPVARAAGDYMGGVLFIADEDRDSPGLRWLRSADGDVVPVESWAPSFFTAEFEDRPTLFYRDSFDDCDGSGLARHDLLTGSKTRAICNLGDSDGGIAIRSSGGNMFVGVDWAAVGAGGTSRTLRFFDAAGLETQPAHNPHPESCAPCELEALLSPAGSLLAYQFRPDAKWPDTEQPTEDWWERSRHIPAEVMVLDLTTGRERWRIEVPADVRLVDFDGRYLVTQRNNNSTIHDTHGLVAELDVPGGGVALLHHPIASPNDGQPHVLWDRFGSHGSRNDNYLPDATGSTLALSADPAGMAMVVNRGAVADGRWLTELWTSDRGFRWAITDLPTQLQRRHISSVGRGEFGYLIGTHGQHLGNGPPTEVWMSSDGAHWKTTVLDDEEVRVFSEVISIVPGPGGAVVHLMAQSAPGTGPIETLFFARKGAEFIATEGNYGAPGAPQWAWVAAQPDRYVALTQQGSLEGPLTEQRVIMSADGTTWTTVAHDPFGPDRHTIAGIAATDDAVVVVAADNGRIRLLRSGNLEEWTVVTPPQLAATSPWATRIAAGQRGFLLAVWEEDDLQLWFSPDGQTWERTHDREVAADLGGEAIPAVGSETLVVAQAYFEPRRAPHIWVGTPVGHD